MIQRIVEYARSQTRDDLAKYLAHWPLLNVFDKVVIHDSAIRVAQGISSVSRLVLDHELRERFRQGDKRALRQVYDEYVKPVYVFLRRGFITKQGHMIQMHEPWDLENTVQEVFVRAFSERARRAYDGIRPYHNYLFAIARNVVVDRIKQTARVKQYQETYTDEAVESARPDAIVESAQLVQHIDNFVAKLDPLEFSIFKIRFQEGLSVEDSAKKLNQSEYRIKRTEKNLRKRFLKTMQTLGYFSDNALHPEKVLASLLITAIFLKGLIP